MTGAKFTQLLLQLVVGFIQHLVVLCFLLLVQSEGVVQLETHAAEQECNSRGFDLTAILLSNMANLCREQTCFKAALAWELCADSVAAALWGVARVAATTGLTFGCEGESGPASMEV